VTISNQKVTFEQEMQEQKSRFQLEEIQRKQDLEDKIRALQTTKSDIEVKFYSIISGIAKRVKFFSFFY
jgi:hypothetical protein